MESQGAQGPAQQQDGQPANQHEPEAEQSDEELTDVVDGSDDDGSGSSSGDEGPDGPGSGGALAGVAAAAAAAATAGDDWAGSGRWEQPLGPIIAVAEGYMQAGKYENAVNEYSSLLRRSSIAGGTGADPTARARHAALLLGRSAGYAGLSQQLRSIPAAQSESRAIFAPDPCQLAALGLKDADMAVMALGATSPPTMDAHVALAAEPGLPEAQLHRGRCLVLLERYQEAEEAYRRGLAAQPTHEQLLAALQELQEVLSEGGGGGGGGNGGPSSSGGGGGVEACAATERGGTAGGGRRLRPLADDAECILCMKLLFEPVTTPCGHTFCKTCFSRAMDHGNKCPMCRRVLHVGQELAVTVVLKALLEKSFPEEYEQRRAEEREVAAAVAPAADAPLPLFIMSLLLPGEQMALNIFEPRYRLMIRRCMEGSKRFGMGTVNRQHQLYEVAVEAEITECLAQPDGRFYVEIVGRRRFRPAETWEQDGYRVARPEYLQDEAPAETSAEAASLLEAAAEVEALADAFVEQLRGLAQSRRGVLELLHRTGDRPAAAAASPEALSFWVANLVCSMLPDEGALKHTFLSTRSTLERLQAERHLLQQLGSAQQAQGCSIM